MNAIPVQPTSTITSLQASYINLRRRIPVTAHKDLTMASKFEDDELGVHLSSAITSEKAALIDQVKSQLDADLLTGEREDVFPDTFHDFKFLRLLHGFGDDVNKVAETIKWIIEQRKKYGWNKVRKEMEAIDVENDDGLTLTDNVTRCSSEHILRYLDQENNDMDARLRYVPGIIGLTKEDTKYARKGTPYIYNPYCIFDTPKYCEEVKDKEICKNKPSP